MHRLMVRAFNRARFMLSVASVTAQRAGDASTPIDQPAHDIEHGDIKSPVFILLRQETNSLHFPCGSVATGERQRMTA